MRLKYLDLQGYKTFATKTDFLFDSGITAIVGPNGSGKSNIADAVRWVLGEQSYSVLRAKRTEDMIFSGSAQRPRLGMAQVSLVLDNYDGWLPIEYSEVTISRRAYRSGENEYLLNGKRVRLKDITELLAKGGLSRRTYTVIGQGLIDATLSLRPEERRILFEEAAGITVYQAKRQESIAKLEATQGNILRVNDIINEIAPRLKHLEEQAQRAHEYDRLSKEVEGLLRIWHGYRWRQKQKALSLAQAKVEAQRRQLDQRQDKLEELERRIAQTRTQQSERRRNLSAWHRQANTLRAQAEDIQRELAVRQERQRLLNRQREEILAEIATLELNRTAQRETVERIEGKLGRLESELAEQRGQMREAQKRLEACQGQRMALLKELQAAQKQVFDLATALADRGNRLVQLDERRRKLEKEKREQQIAIAEGEDQLAFFKSHLQALQAEVDDLKVKREALVRQREGLETAVEACRERQNKRWTALAEAREEEGRLQTRREMLLRMRHDMAGYQTGVRAVLRAGGRGQEAKSQWLKGIIGVVASLVQVPAELEQALEAVLGPHLQDIVVESQTQAEEALELLKEKGSGRATLLPLDAIRPLETLAPPDEPDVIGLVVELVNFQPRLRPIFDLLLGRVILASDLNSARRIQKRMGKEVHPYRIATLDGHVICSEGSISGGTTRAEGDRILAREREWRELPGQLAAVTRRREEIEAQGHAIEEEKNRLLTEIVSLKERDHALETAQEEKKIELEAERRETERLSQEVKWRQAIEGQLREERETLDEKETLLGEEMESLGAQETTLQQRIKTLQEELEALVDDELRAELAQLRTKEALLEGNCQSQQAVLESHQANLSQLEDQLAAKQGRVEELSQESRILAGEVKELNARTETLLTRIQALAEHIESAEAELVTLERAQTELEEEEARHRTRLREYESIYSQTVLELQRQQDELTNLQREIENDLGPVELEMVEGLIGQPPLPLKPLVSTLLSMEALPEGLEEEIQRLKAQRRRLGSINPNAPTEYDEALQRYSFLTAQAEDLQKAAESLQEIITELNQRMEKDFTQTFQAIATEFRQYFSILFGGGTAKLILTDAEKPLETGIDIVAQLPGQRQQSLALLSGGERALTGAALIFAILKVSPTPFCILDEVDAMLDEANIGRFRETLKELSERTQFIIITHNRGTIEMADTIYGISMGKDSVSKVVSLRLEEVSDKVIKGAGEKGGDEMIGKPLGLSPLTSDQ